MQKLLPILVILTLTACKHTSTTPDHTTGMTKVQKWSGSHSQGYYSNVGHPGPDDFYHTITDTTFSITKISEDLIFFPMLDYPLRYRSTDSITHARRFDSSGSLWIMTPPSLVYYADQDSMVFSCMLIAPGGAYGMDDPYLEEIYLHTHK